MISSRRFLGSTARRPGHVDAAAARRDAGERRRGARFGHHLGEDAEAIEGTVRIGDEAVAADLVARERLRVDEDDAAAGARQPLCRRGAGRTGADDDRVAAFGKEIEIEVHEGRASCRVALARLPGPMRQAATVAQAVMAPTSAKVS
jgi:hypothetical protein